MDRIIRAALPGYPCGWFAPTYKYSAPVFDALKTRLAPMIASKDESRKLINLHGGGSIEVWTLDNDDAGRSRKYKRIVVDEAAIVGKLESIWTESLRPTLADYVGDAWFLSTPKGIAQYFHALYQRGRDQTRADWASWQMPTSTNPYISPTEIEAAREDITDLAFQQEYLAQFVTWEGAVFRRIMDAVDEGRRRGRASIIGVDWGRTNDYTVFVALDPVGCVVGIDRFRGIEYSLQRARLAAFHRNMGSQAVIIAEVNSMGGPVVEQLQRDGLPVRAFTTTSQTKAAIIQELALGFERGIIKIPNDTTLIGELQAYEGKRTPSGMTKYGAPDGLHDDMVMALAIGWAGLTVMHTPATEHQIVGEYQISPV